ANQVGPVQPQQTDIRLLCEVRRIGGRSQPPRQETQQVLTVTLGQEGNQFVRGTLLRTARSSIPDGCKCTRQPYEWIFAKTGHLPAGGTSLCSRNCEHYILHIWTWRDHMGMPALQMEYFVDDRLARLETQV